MKAISPHRIGVTSFSSSSSSSLSSSLEYDTGEYVLSVATTSATTAPAAAAAAAAVGGGTTTFDDSTTHRDDGSIVAAALSDRSIVLYDARVGTVVDRIIDAHGGGPISGIEFMPSSSSSSTCGASVLVSAGHDGYVRSWDFRCRSTNGGGGGGASGDGGKSSSFGRLGLPNERALCLSIGYGGNLISVGTDMSRVSFFDFRHASSSSSSSSSSTPSGGGGGGGGGGTASLLGSYVDAHTDDVTCVRFATCGSIGGGDGRTVLASASEDGLVVLHDPRMTTEDRALISILNVGSPIRRVGFFGPHREGLYALTGNETMCVYHWDSGQRVCDVGGGMGLRRSLSDAIKSHSYSSSLSGGVGGGGMVGGEGIGASSGNGMITDDDFGDNNAVEYLVGCTWTDIPHPSSSSSSSSSCTPALHLLAGNSDGDGYLFRIDVDRVTPLTHLRGGHRGCIRDFGWIQDDRGGGMRLVTGGEDARLCEWDLTSAGRDDENRFAVKSGAGTIGGGRVRPAKGGNGDDRGGMGRMGKKKFGSPY